MHGIIKVMLILSLSLWLAACTGEDQKAPAPVAPAEPAKEQQAEQPAVAQDEESVAERVEEAIEQAGERTDEIAAAVSERSAQTYEEVKESAAQGIEKIKETGSEAMEKTKETVEDVIQKTAAATAEKTAEIASPGVIVYQARNGNVTFDHELHIKVASCNQCHQVMPPQKIVLDQASAHKLCIDCHKEMSAGPATCAGCHIR